MPSFLVLQPIIRMLVSLTCYPPSSMSTFRALLAPFTIRFTPLAVIYSSSSPFLLGSGTLTPSVLIVSSLPCQLPFQSLWFFSRFFCHVHPEMVALIFDHQLFESLFYDHFRDLLCQNEHCLCERLDHSCTMRICQSMRLMIRINLVQIKRIKKKG
jgi:hypothetical protein